MIRSADDQVNELTSQMNSEMDLGEETETRAVLGDRFGFLFAKVHLRCARESIAQLQDAGLGLSGMHVGALSVIEIAGPMSQQALGEILEKDRTTMVTVVDELEQEGLVQRRRNPADRRAYALQVTDEGRQWLERARGVLVEAEGDLLGGLDREEQEVLRGLLQRVVFSSPRPGT